MKTKTRIKSFRVHDKIVVGDPCYDTNKTFPAKEGLWEASVDKMNCGDWGNRIGRVTVHHKDFNPALDMKVEHKGFSVDSGQAGVFCGSVYDSSGPFYEDCCRETLSEEGYGFVRGGFVSSSGYGDGYYDMTVYLVRGKAVCVELEFMEE